MKMGTTMHLRLMCFAFAALLGVSGLPAASVEGLQAQEPHRGGEIDLKSVDPDVALGHLKTADDYEINLFASEKEFPLENPVSLTFDTQGRLWVATMPSYPQYLPGHPPDDKLIVLEDTTGDGKADKHTVFADGLHIPTGFELGDGGVYVAQQPNLMFLKDTTGDGKADVRRTVLHGFGTEDSHHAISAFTWGPGGGLYFQEGLFHHTQVETPYGPVRLEDAGVFRYEPKTHKLGVFVSYPFANPWGHVFDRWGQNFIADASPGSNYFGTAISVHVDYPRKLSRIKEFTPTKVRPTAGCEIVSSRHFPDEAQGNFLINNCIGFQGIKQHRIIEEGSGFTAEEVEPLLQSTDINFRPVDIQFGPDGALYIVDWFNPLIGHMQYSLRDPRRDHHHGRIWRITYKHKPLLEPPEIAGRPIPELLDLLKTYEDRTRYRARVELREHPAGEVAAAVKQWIAGLDEAHEDYEHHLLEALWVYQGANAVEPEHLQRVLRSPEPRARAAATRVIRYWHDRLDDPLSLLKIQATDEHPRVRLEAVVACSSIPSAESAEAALESLRHSTDYYLDYVLTETMTTLEKHWKPAVASGEPFAADNPAGLDYVLDKISTQELAGAARSAPVYGALLSRSGVARKYRLEALHGMAKLNQTDQLTELLAAVELADQSDNEQAEAVLSDLAHILTGHDAAGRGQVADLSAARPRLARLAVAAKRPLTRQIGYVAIVTADQAVEPAWQKASQSIRGVRDLLGAVPLIPDTGLRAAFYAHIEPLLHGLPGSLAEQAKQTQGPGGRYVRIELPGNNRILTLAEVEVFSDGRNIASGGRARQSSTSHGGAAGRAIDGNTSGRYSDGGQTHTRGNETDPWWELDLGNEHPIEAITVWNRTEAGGQYADRLEGFKLVVLDANRQPVFARADNPAPVKNVRFEIAPDPEGDVRRGAINAVTSIPGYEAETFTTLARFVREGTDRDAAVQALHRIPQSQWPKEQIGPLAESIVDYATQVPTDERTSPTLQRALQLGNDLAGLLPADQANQIRETIGDLGVTVILIRAVPHAMAYDKPVIAVEAGKPVEIIFDNADIMPHNLIITAPGALAEVGEAAERMATAPDAFARQFIPDSSQVLHATKMLQTTESDALRFIAPQKPGEYPYVCTFPGHWQRMNGVMHVVEDLEQYLADNPLPEATPVGEARAVVQEWAFEDLASDLSKIDHGRSYENGKKMFAAASCIACHRMNDVGGIAGPNLGELDQKETREDILEDILEPSKEIKDEYRSYVIITEEGRQIIGMILSEDDEIVRVMPNPLGMDDCEPIEIPAETIEEKHASKISLMPEGLLNTLTKEEILDLLAYLEARGNPEHAIYSK